MDSVQQIYAKNEISCFTLLVREYIAKYIHILRCAECNGAKKKFHISLYFGKTFIFNENFLFLHISQYMNYRAF